MDDGVISAFVAVAEKLLAAAAVARAQSYCGAEVLA